MINDGDIGDDDDDDQSNQGPRNAPTVMSNQLAAYRASCIQVNPRKSTVARGNWLFNHSNEQGSEALNDLQHRLTAHPFSGQVFNLNLNSMVNNSHRVS